MDLASETQFKKKNILASETIFKYFTIVYSVVECSIV